MENNDPEEFIEDCEKCAKKAFFYLSIFLIFIIIGLLIHFNYKIKKENTKMLNSIDSIKNVVESLENHVQLVDSLHYSKCGWVLKEGIDFVTE